MSTVKVSPAAFWIPEEGAGVLAPPVRARHLAGTVAPAEAIEKRCLDLAVAGLMLAFLAVPMAIVALLIKLTSRGPVTYRQVRIGLDGRPFEILKFRSMPTNSEERTGPVWSRKGDSRPTLVGRWMRRTGFDELPQLINVFKGDMSLVGPRPERPYFVEKFSEELPGYSLRHSALPGLTGLAQVRGWRGDTSLEERLACDLEYLRHWSFWLDLKLILATPFSIIRGERG